MREKYPLGLAFVIGLGSFIALTRRLTRAYGRQSMPRMLWTEAYGDFDMAAERTRSLSTRRCCTTCNFRDKFQR